MLRRVFTLRGDLKLGDKKTVAVDREKLKKRKEMRAKRRKKPAKNDAPLTIVIDGIELPRPPRATLNENAAQKKGPAVRWNYTHPSEGRQFREFTLSKYKSRLKCWEAMLEFRDKTRKKLKRECGVDIT